MHFGFWIEIEPFLGHFPRDVRTEESDRKEERLIARRLELVDGPIDDRAIALTSVERAAPNR